MYITPKKFLLFFISIMFLFLFYFFSTKKVNSEGESLVCPGLKLFKNWCAGEHIENNEKACLVVARPQRSQGNYTKRGTTTITIYHLLTQDSQGVFYTTAGYIYKNASFVTINIDKKNEFELRLIENDSAWTDDDSIDQDIIKAMKKGNTMKVIGYSKRGTKTTDTYSLMGFTAAYKYISQICDITN